MALGILGTDDGPEYAHITFHQPLMEGLWAFITTPRLEVLGWLMSPSSGFIKVVINTRLLRPWCDVLLKLNLEYLPSSQWFALDIKPWQPKEKNMGNVSKC